MVGLTDTANAVYNGLMNVYKRLTLGEQAFWTDEKLLREFAFAVCFDYHSDCEKTLLLKREIERRFLSGGDHPLLVPYIEALASIPYNLEGNYYAVKDAVMVLAQEVYNREYRTAIQRKLEMSLDKH